MQFASVLLICIFVLTCTGTAHRTCARLRIRPGRLAAWTVLMLILSALPVKIGAGTLNPASLLLLWTAAVLCYGTADILLALVLALLTGLGGWMLLRLLPNAAEPGVLLALFPAVLAFGLMPRKRMALLAVSAAPLFSGLGAFLEDAILFGFCVAEIGGGKQLDAQITGLFLLAVLWYLPARAGRRKTIATSMKKLS